MVTGYICVVHMKEQRKTGSNFNSEPEAHIPASSPTFVLFKFLLCDLRLRDEEIYPKCF